MSLLVPLSSVDQAGTETSLSVFGYVLDGQIDADALRSAALRLVDKWRLLAGTLEWANGTYNVRVPLGPLDAGERVRFTRTALPTTPLPTPVPRAEDAAWTMRPPAYKYFVHRDTAGALATLAKRGLPILSIHVTSFADYTCVGIAAPHGVLDGTGQGALTQYLDAELNGAYDACIHPCPIGNRRSARSVVGPASLSFSPSSFHSRFYSSSNPPSPQRCVSGSSPTRMRT